MPIRALERSTNSLIYELPPGKPDPYDDRGRIKQKAQTISACQYYVLNRLRHRIGKYPLMFGLLGYWMNFLSRQVFLK